MNFVTIAREAATESWVYSLEHPFIQELQQGTLSKACFRYYLLQDRYYLAALQSVYLAIEKQTEQPTIKTMMQDGAKRLIAGEIGIRDTFFDTLQITAEEVQQTPIATVPQAYVAHMHQQLTYSVSVAFASLLPCAWLYQEIGLALSSGSPHPVYQRWIDTCITPESMRIVHEEQELLNHLYQEASMLERQQMVNAFVTSTQMEASFWDMAYGFDK